MMHIILAYIVLHKLSICADNFFKSKYTHKMMIDEMNTCAYIEKKIQPYQSAAKMKKNMSKLHKTYVCGCTIISTATAVPRLT